MSVRCQLLTTWNTRNKSHRFKKHSMKHSHRKCLDGGGPFRKVIGWTPLSITFKAERPDLLRPPEPHSNNWRLTTGVRGNIRRASLLCGESWCVVVFIKPKRCPPKKNPFELFFDLLMRKCNSLSLNFCYGRIHTNVFSSCYPRSRFLLFFFVFCGF